MKTLILQISKFFLFFFFFFIQDFYAQTPQKLSYQAVIRNTAGVLINNGTIGIKISVLQGSISGTVVYSETHSLATNTNGLATLEIGNGSIVTGDFTAIDWSNGPFFIKTETDPLGGINYTIVGTSQLLSVPYALLAEKVVKPTYSATVSATNNGFFSQTDRNIIVDDPNINVVIPETGKYLVNFYGYLVNSNTYNQTSSSYDQIGTIAVYNTISQINLVSRTAVVPFYDNDGAIGTIKYISTPVSASVIVNLIANDVLKLTYQQNSTATVPNTTWGISLGGISITKIGD